ncbi:hypothetical protein NQ318_022466 [Aromia moschata]|uniref:DUF4817 domain-containing protein n=1 Tax=Aromia moschata TaxID=1265417 RepID=A0AAV8Z4V1_9CUCU|nr:hypothetical protein NQ318_022466 [Aromia moschata]
MCAFLRAGIGKRLLGHTERDGEDKMTQSEVCTVFNGIYPDTPVSQGTVCQLIKKFRETGNVKDVKRTDRPKSATSEEKALNVLLTIKETPQVSTREVADNLGISHLTGSFRFCVAIG